MWAGSVWGFITLAAACFFGMLGLPPEFIWARPYCLWAAAIFLAIGLVILCWPLRDDKRRKEVIEYCKHPIRAVRKLAPIHLIAFGLAIALSGVVWQLSLNALARPTQQTASTPMATGPQTMPQSPSSTLLNPASDKPPQKTFPRRFPKDAQNEIEVIDQLIQIFRVEARPQVEEGLSLTRNWWLALVDPSHHQNYSQSLLQFRDKTDGTLKKIYKLIADHPQYCDQDLCEIVDAHKNDDLTNGIYLLEHGYTLLHNGMSPNYIKGFDISDFQGLMRPLEANTQTVLGTYRDWINQSEYALLARRRELAEAASAGK